MTPVLAARGVSGALVAEISRRRSRSDRLRRKSSLAPRERSAGAGEPEGRNPSVSAERRGGEGGSPGRGARSLPEGRSLAPRERSAGAGEPEGRNPSAERRH